MNGRGLQETKRAHTNPTESALPELRRSVCLELFAVAFSGIDVCWCRSHRPAAAAPSGDSEVWRFA